MQKGKYRTRAIITRGLYMFLPTFTIPFLWFQGGFSENYVWLIIKSGLWWRAYGTYTLWWLINKFNIPKDTLDKDDSYSQFESAKNFRWIRKKKYLWYWYVQIIFLGLLTSLLNKTHLGKKKNHWLFPGDIKVPTLYLSLFCSKEEQ